MTHADNQPETVQQEFSVGDIARTLHTFMEGLLVRECNAENAHAAASLAAQISNLARVSIEGRRLAIAEQKAAQETAQLASRQTRKE